MLTHVIGRYKGTPNILTEVPSRLLPPPISLSETALSELSLHPTILTLLIMAHRRPYRRAWPVSRHHSLEYPMVTRRTGTAMVIGHHRHLSKLLPDRRLHRGRRRSCSRGAVARTCIRSHLPRTHRRLSASVLDRLVVSLIGDIVYQALSLLSLSPIRSFCIGAILCSCLSFSPTSVLDILFSFKLLTMDEYLQYFDTRTPPLCWRYRYLCSAIHDTRHLCSPWPWSVTNVVLDNSWRQRGKAEVRREGVVTSDKAPIDAL